MYLEVLGFYLLKYLTFWQFESTQYSSIPQMITDRYHIILECTILSDRVGQHRETDDFVLTGMKGKASRVSNESLESILL